MKKICLIVVLSINFLSCRPLSVLFVTNKFPYEPRQYIDNQITGFIDAGINVRVLAKSSSSHADYSLAKQYKFQDITFYNELPPDQRSFDIIYCQFPGRAKLMLSQRKNNLLSGKIVACFRAGSEFRDIEKNIQKYKIFFDEVDLILVVCKAFQDRLVQYGCPIEKIMVHHSAIDIERFFYKKRHLNSNDKINCITIGRLDFMKGHSFLIKAMAQVKNVYPTIQYNIYGMGSEYEALSKMIQEYGLEETVFLKGYCPHNLVPNLLYDHHIFLIASHTTEDGSQEGIPNVLMEAMATGMPVVATKHSGIPELIEEEIMNFLVNEKNSDEMAEKIIYLIQNSEYWGQFGKAARKKILKEHSKEKQNKILIEVFNKMKNCKV